MIESFLKYIAYEKRYSAHTSTSYANDLNQFADFCKSTFEITDVTSVDYTTIRTWIVALMDQGMEPRTINRKIASLKSYYKFLQKTGHIDTNPTLRIKAPKVKKRLPVFVDEPSVDRLFDEQLFDTGFAGLRDQLVLELLYGTGIRLSELLQLQYGDINFSQHTIKVLGKGNKQRIIPIHKNLENLIVAYNNQKALTFNEVQSKFLLVTDKGLDPYPVLIQRIVRKYLQLVTTIEKKSPHVMRHSFATHLLNNGADLNAIKELLGHSSLAATQVYTHNSIEKLKQIFNQAHPKA